MTLYVGRPGIHPTAIDAIPAAAAVLPSLSA